MYLPELFPNKFAAVLLAFCSITVAAHGPSIAATKPSGSSSAERSSPDAGLPSRDYAPLAAVYILLKQPDATFILASARPAGAGYRTTLINMAKARELNIVLPVAADILQEAMAAVRIAVHDSKGLRSIAAMQGAGIVLAGRLVDTGGDKGWHVTWSIDNLIGRLRWQIVNVSYEVAIAEGLDVLQRVMAGELEVTRHPLPKLRPLIQRDVEAQKSGSYRERDLENGLENVR